MRYRKKTTIRAIRYVDNEHEIFDFANRYANRNQALFKAFQKNFFIIETLEGTLKLNHGDWLAVGIEGEMYPIKNDIFIKTYEPVNE